MNKSRPHTKSILLLILGGYLLITLAYGLIVPLFETPDEHFHFFTAHYFAVNGELAVVRPDYDPLLGPEPAQPPLFYIVAGLLSRPWLEPEAREQVVLNPFAWIGSATATANINRSLTTPYELWPWTGYALAAHLMRLISTAFGLGTLIFVFAAARRLWPADSRYALTATAVLAFWPQFNFIHGAVTNDSLIILLATAVLYQIILLWQAELSWPRTIALGSSIGLAVLTKNAGVLLLLFTLLVIVLQTISLALHSFSWLHWRKTGLHLVTLIAMVLLMAGWLWLRNQALYDDWTATNQFVAVAGGDRNYSLGQVMAESGGLWLSLFAIFGWFNLRAPDWVYAVWNGLVLFSLAGAVNGLFHTLQKQKSPLPLSLGGFLRSSWMIVIFLAGWLLLVYAGLLLFMLQTEAAQGRLLMPAILPLVMGLIAGWGLWGERLRALLFKLAPAAALLTSLYCLLFVIRPAYALPQRVDAVQPTAVPVQAELLPGITLLAIDQPDQSAQPGDLVWFTLYWQASQIPEAAPELKFELLGQDLSIPLTQIHTYHGRGLFPVSYWSPGKIMADRVALRLPGEINAPLLAKSFTRLIDPQTGSSAGITAGEVKIIPSTWPPLADSLTATVGETIGIVTPTLNKNQARAGDSITINLQWQILNSPEKNLTTLVHLAERGQPPLAQADGPPRGGSYPTSAWEAGEFFSDSYTLIIPADLPPGRYPVWIGMYDPDNFVREPLWINGVRQPDDQLLVGEIEVLP